MLYIYIRLKIGKLGGEEIMLKRVDKIIALLVAIATVSTTIPAFATTRLGTQEGEFSQAFSYAEGKFVYNGYRTAKKKEKQKTN